MAFFVFIFISTSYISRELLKLQDNHVEINCLELCCEFYILSGDGWSHETNSYLASKWKPLFPLSNVHGFMQVIIEPNSYKSWLIALSFILTAREEE